MAEAMPLHDRYTPTLKMLQLMEAVEARVKEIGAWGAADDDCSGSVCIKSKGMAQIDWRITDLGREGRLINCSYDRWRLP
jgi:hypothetical protein